MIVIDCPFCGARNEDEFLCWSDAGPQRPADPAALDDAAWVDYVYMRANTKGQTKERWWHARGCHQWLIVERNTVTHEVVSVEAAKP